MLVCMIQSAAQCLIELTSPGGLGSSLESMAKRAAASTYHSRYDFVDCCGVLGLSAKTVHIFVWVFRRTIFEAHGATQDDRNVVA